MRLALLQYLHYYSGLERNSKYLQGTLVEDVYKMTPLVMAASEKVGRPIFIFFH